MCVTQAYLEGQGKFICTAHYRIQCLKRIKTSITVTFPDPDKEKSQKIPKVALRTATNYIFIVDCFSD